MRPVPIFVWLLISTLPAHAASIVGVWESDCQNVNRTGEYKSARPVDTFTTEGTATLRVHVFEAPNCQGKEWDAETIPCTYHLGGMVSALEETRELDLACDLRGPEHWYEIAEIRENTLRYGNHTGTTPEDRPKNLGNVVYRKVQ